MPFVSLHELFPEVAERETRVLTVLHGASIPLPPGEYSFIEMFCDEPDCDCRRAFFTVVSLPAKKVEAVISWGWENAAFYKRWLGFGDPEMIEHMQGPTLDLGSPISKNAKVLLAVFIDLLLADPVYVERVKKHYGLFRTAIHSGKKLTRVRPRPAQAVAGSGTEVEARLSRPVISVRPDRHGASVALTRQQPDSGHKVGRNHPCPCGSGKKFKNCCLQ